MGPNAHAALFDATVQDALHEVAPPRAPLQKPHSLSAETWGVLMVRKPHRNAVVRTPAQLDRCTQAVALAAWRGLRHAARAALDEAGAWRWARARAELKLRATAAELRAWLLHDRNLRFKGIADKIVEAAEAHDPAAMHRHVKALRRKPNGAGCYGRHLRA